LSDNRGHPLEFVSQVLALSKKLYKQTGRRIFSSGGLGIVTNPFYTTGSLSKTFFRFGHQSVPVSAHRYQPVAQYYILTPFGLLSTWKKHFFAFPVNPFIL